jgi:hypothetical protein
MWLVGVNKGGKTYWAGPFNTEKEADKYEYTLKRRFGEHLNIFTDEYLICNPSFLENWLQEQYEPE